MTMFFALRRWRVAADRRVRDLRPRAAAALHQRRDGRCCSFAGLRRDRRRRVRARGRPQAVHDPPHCSTPTRSPKTRSPSCANAAARPTIRTRCGTASVSDRRSCARARRSIACCAASATRSTGRTAWCTSRAPGRRADADEHRQAAADQALHAAVRRQRRGGRGARAVAPLGSAGPAASLAGSFERPSSCRARSTTGSTKPEPSPGLALLDRRLEGLSVMFPFDQPAADGVLSDALPGDVRPARAADGLRAGRLARVLLGRTLAGAKPATIRSMRSSAAVAAVRPERGDHGGRRAAAVPADPLPAASSTRPTCCCSIAGWRSCRC